MIRKIYLDLDGVITDFERKYREVFDTDPACPPNRFSGWANHFSGSGRRLITQLLFKKCTLNQSKLEIVYIKIIKC
jgi:hypothetical protein